MIFQRFTSTVIKSSPQIMYDVCPMLAWTYMHVHMYRVLIAVHLRVIWM